MENKVKSPKIREQKTTGSLPKTEEQAATIFPMTREQEEEHLKQTVAIVERNVQYYYAGVEKMSAEIEVMIRHFHDDNPELYNVLENTTTMNENFRRALFRNQNALKKAYFGRIDYTEGDPPEKECIYIGKGGVSRDSAHIEVVDWRAPIAAAYYESRTGACFYTQPDGTRKEIDVTLKRTYEIDGKRLIDFFDSETVSNDELLTKYLAKNKQAVLGEIIASIQKEQDDIIRKSPFWNVLVQGVAGSGKTTVAMHRISFILYNYPERFRPQDFYIIGSNHILLNYITGVLPELDVYGAGQMTMAELFAKLMYENFDAKKHKIVAVANEGEYAKGASKWFFELSEFCDGYEYKTVKHEDIVLNRKMFVQGFYNGTTGVHDITATSPATERDLVTLMTGEEVERYLREMRTISMQAKIEMLNVKLDNRLDVELTGKGITYTDEEKKAIRRYYRQWYGKVGADHDIFGIYREFLNKQNEKGYRITCPCDEFDVYDLAALAYLYKRIKETDPIREASHIVIDEAQDFGMMVYLSLKYCIPGCTYTIMGDVSQNIHFGYGLTDWEELKALVLTGVRDSFGILKKSYRNTVEIADFASGILRHGQGKAYVAEPVIRHGDEVRIAAAADEEALLHLAAEAIGEWQAKGLNTIAVVCRNPKQSAHIHERLGKLVTLQDNKLETAVFGTGVIVLPVEYTKGLEFDAVLIVEPDRESYPTDSGHAKLLYVAATRALHELCILHCHPLTGLIVDPIPENSLIEEVEEQSTEPNIILGQDHDDAVIKEMHERERNKILSKTPVNTMQKQPPEEKPLTEAVSRKAVKRLQTEGIASTNIFGKRPLPAELKMGGHTAAEQSVRWAEKRADGLYVMSRSGVLVIRPLEDGCVRITFEKGIQPTPLAPPFDQMPSYKKWEYREKKEGMELKTPSLTVFLEKTTGCLHYLNANGKRILSDKPRESRAIEKGMSGRNKAWQFFEWPREESIWGVCDSDNSKNFNVNDHPGYLSDAKAKELPWFYSTNGYAVVILSESKTVISKSPSVGNFFCTDGDKLDYCVIVGKNKSELLERKAKLGL